MTSPKPVAIIGLGLMGGSLARDLAARAVPVLAFDRTPEVLAKACDEGIVRNPLNSDLEGIEAADVVVLATPVDVATETLKLLREKAGRGTAITDVGSTKRAIVERATALDLGERFVGSHPLTGDHRSGWDATRLGLYERVPVFVCPTPSSSEIAIRRILDLWLFLGAVPSLQDAADHDRRMAWTSHLPQVISSALATVIRDGFDATDLGPGGRDMTRLADSSPEMWTAISRANSDNLLVALRRFQVQLSKAEEAIARDDPAALRDFFERGRHHPS